MGWRFGDDSRHPIWDVGCGRRAAFSFLLPSESSVYCILKEAGPVASPAYVLLSASDAFKGQTKRVDEMASPSIMGPVSGVDSLVLDPARKTAMDAIGSWSCVGC